MLLKDYVGEIQHLMINEAGELIPDPIIGLGLSGESAEMAEAFMELARNTNPNNVPALRKKFLLEAGDVLWYVAALCVSHNIEIDDVDVQVPIGTESIATRIGKVNDKIKKAEWHGRRYARTELCIDLSQLLSHLREYAKFGEKMLEDVADMNVEKLKSRYPNGFVQGGGIRA